MNEMEIKDALNCICDRCNGSYSALYFICNYCLKTVQKSDKEEKKTYRELLSLVASNIANKNNVDKVISAICCVCFEYQLDNSKYIDELLFTDKKVVDIGNELKNAVSCKNTIVRRAKILKDFLN